VAGKERGRGAYHQHGQQREGGREGGRGTNLLIRVRGGLPFTVVGTAAPGRGRRWLVGAAEGGRLALKVHQVGRRLAAAGQVGEGLLTALQLLIQLRLGGQRTRRLVQALQLLC